MKLEEHIAIISRGYSSIELFEAGERLGIPDRMVNAIDRYVTNCVPVGDFLQAVLTNNLKEAALRADDVNVKLLYPYILLIYNHIPGVCWGNEKKYKEWLTRIEHEENATA